MPTCPDCGEDNPERARFCMSCSAPLVKPVARGTRRTVTIVFSDLVGSTALGERLDSEALREVLDLYFEEMRVRLERHGGVVEKFIGDAVMAVFGLPRAHEDDALRALRAASEMREALEGLNGKLESRWGVRLSNRTGVHTGEVVAGEPAHGQRLVTGDTVNTAARLEQAASAGEVLIGATTYALARDTIDVESVEPVLAKGKAEPVTAYRLVALRSGWHRADLFDTPMVGRDVELRTLVDTFESARERCRCVLARVVGEAGVGKSRLVAEFLSSIGERGRIARGRCLPYGEGITYWALSEALRASAGITEGDTRAAAAEKLQDLCRDAQDADLIAARLATAIGLATDPYPEEEVAWSLRGLVKHLATDRPFVLVVDDVQWADPALLEALVSIVSGLLDTAALIVCVARPELDERHGGWADGIEGLVSLRLDPLTQTESEHLLDGLLGGIDLPGETRDRITRAAGGNPLFIEQMLSMWRDLGVLEPGPSIPPGPQGDPAFPIPPSIHALLTARLDGLPPQERSTLERGAVVGEVFDRAAVEALAPDALRPHVAASLGSLERRALIRPDESPFAGDAGFAFVHLLVLDVTYEGTLKRTRADLHEAFAGWLGHRAGDRIAEYEEIVAYHFERAHRILLELGSRDERAVAVRDQAVTHLRAAADRAFAANNMRAAAALYERIVQLCPRDDAAVTSILPDLGSALIQIGELERARSELAGAEQRAASAGDHGSELLAQLAQIQLSIKVGLETTVRSIRLETGRLIERCLELGHDRAAATGFHVLGEICWWEADFASAQTAFEQAVVHAERARDQRMISDSLAWLAVAMHHGPTSVDEGLRRCAEIAERAPGDRLVQLAATNSRAGLLSMRGEFEEARELIRHNRGVWQDLGWVVEEAADSQLRGEVELRAGDLAAAERELRWGCDVLERMGETGYLSTTAGMLARVLVSLGRLDEADRYLDSSEATGADDDVRTQAEWRLGKAEVLIAHGDHTAATEIAEAAVRWADRSDVLNLGGDARMVLAIALEASGSNDQAARAARDALDLFHRKGNLVSSERAQGFLDRLEREPLQADRPSPRPDAAAPSGE